MTEIISLGAGVQSSTMALMAAEGDLTPMPSCAIFADTQAEPRAVYEWLDWLTTMLPFPVHRVTSGNLTEISTTPKVSGETGLLYLPHAVPVFILNTDGSFGQVLRQCTDKHKLTPIRKEILRQIGSDGTARVWIGISLDEVQRMKDSNHSRIQHSWPLIERKMSRQDCLKWLNRNAYPTPPRSACSYCPYHNDAEWRRLKTEHPDAFADAVSYELRLQEAYKLVPRLTGTPFLHASRKPLTEVDFSTEEERGQLNLFGNECAGLCGV